MIYFTKLPVVLPTITSTLTCPEVTTVSIINSLPIIELLNLPWSGQEIRLIQVWIAPHSRVNIHKDADAVTGQKQLWGLLLPVVNYDTPVTEIYTAIDETKLSTTSYQTGPVPFLPFNNAKLEESYDLSNGPAFFDSGSLWHSARNDTDRWQHCLSIRSLTIPKETIYNHLIKRWE